MDQKWTKKNDKNRTNLTQRELLMAVSSVQSGAAGAVHSHSALRWYYKVEHVSDKYFTLCHIIQIKYNMCYLNNM